MKSQGGSVNNHRGKKNLVLSAWGDDALLSEAYVNPYYISDDYQSYSEQTQQNLVSASVVLNYVIYDVAYLQFLLSS